jgi:hypothetical protein
VSLGLENSAEEVDTLLHVLGNIAAQPQSGSDESVQRQMNDFANVATQRVYTQLA